ncbi:putative pentatricopeptide repeat-containing protein At5g37570 isoform X1 [Vigna angularis]|uniref:putative pentatricopeptide repeat-containing protein At5g37570 isoform X1 n=1 Tax=Phaseolus angularis TaxID=3914 RepID=UPI0022B3BD24|nr:putative pentatricopeptide repeat-containing protein At5g37570 isoform X1 [Vigna angularis]
MVRSHGVTLVNRLARRSFRGANHSVYQSVFQRGYRTLNSGLFHPSRVTGSFTSNVGGGFNLKKWLLLGGANKYWEASRLIHGSGASIITFLKACKSSEQLKQVHASIIYRGLEQDHFLISLFIPLSHTLSTLSYTSSVFLRVLTPSTFLWNTLMKSHCHNSCFSQTLTAFTRMKAHGVLPDTFTYPSVIKACCATCMPWEGKSLHGSAIRCGVDRDLYVATSLVDMYGKFGQIDDARRVFDGISKRSVVSWTAMLVGYVAVGDVVEAEKLFNEMPQRNVASWNAMLQGFIKLGNLSGARDMFEAMLEKNVVSFTTMIDGYAKVGDMVAARFLFDRAPGKDVVAWSALISGYVQNGQPNQALKVFFEMESMNVKPDEFILVSLMSASTQLGNLELAQWVDSYVSKSCIDFQQDHVIAALLDMNAKCGNMDRASKLFEERPKRDLVLYCSMIQGLSIHGRGEQAVNLFNRMLMEGLYPDEVAFTVILTACSHAGLVDEGWNYFQSMKQKYYISPSSDHYACMVDLLSRSGHVRDAYELLKLMPEPHAGAWGALLGACKLYGDSELGEIVANRLLQFDHLNAANYVLLSDIYAAAERWIDVSLVRSKMRERRVRKIPGCSKI